MKQFLVLAIINLILFSGCNKDGGTVIDPASKQVLKKYSTIEDGETLTHEFKYDNQNRLQSFGSEEEDYSGVFTYDAKGQVAKIVLDSEGNKHQVDITYNANGLPKNAVMKSKLVNSPNTTRTTNITYETKDGRVQKITLESQDYESGVYKLGYTNNNLTRIEASNVDGSVILTSKFGTKKSPFFNSRMKFILLPDIFYDLFSENEPLETKIEIPEVIQVVTKHKYNYGDHSFPLSVEDIDADGQVERVTNFTYK